MFPGFGTGFAAVLDDALFGADVVSFQVERAPFSWRSPAGELVEAVRVHAWLESLTEMRRVLPRLGLALVQRTPAAPMWGGWLTTDAAAAVSFPVVLELSCFGVYADDLAIAADGTVVAAASERVG